MLLNEAIKLWQRGLSVFPVDKETKTPLIKWGRLQEELPTLEEITEWFSLNNRGIGVVTGKISNLFLVDFDFAKHPEAKEWYEKQTWPRTWKETTKSGGVHLYFKFSNALSEKKTTTTSEVFSGVDTRGNGGYSKISPSEGYKWINPPHLTLLVEPPQWFIDLLPDKDRIIEGKSIIGTLSTIKDGNRNNSFTSLAGSLRARGYSVREMFEFLKPKAKEESFSEEELLSICNSVGRYKTEILEDSGDSLIDFMADKRETDYIVASSFAENTINIIAGLQESRKSWLLLDLAIAIASGGLWLNKFQCKKKKVLVIDQERPKLEMQRRLSALLSAKSLELKDLEGFLIPKVGSTMRINLDQSYTKLTNMIETLKPEVILIDSLKAFQNGDITNNQSMQDVFERIKHLRAQYKLTFIILHHENKGAHQRKREGLEVTTENIAGAASIVEVPESIFVAVNHDVDNSFLYHVKNSYGFKQAPFLVSVKDIEDNKIKVEAY